ncbi:hypothetical protein Acor_59750 [Acrocarpospora corrugata]|uniref:DUF3618 domain-containing protein n=1 Tax=Acrocarpospora corrugata TaxID=35763 RepID=A0A5M3W6H3_9ACTN|nr:DUF3618 domain-containing protein [Acrocarpospora corrugata]GES03909.1 hypothetical protein Acor_59750 [Acrocarpospora corrugata]
MTRAHRTSSEDVAAIAEDAERTRAELGRTVAALAAKADVRSRAKSSVKSKAMSAKSTASSGAHQVADKANRHPAAVYGTTFLVAMGALARTLFRRRNMRAGMKFTGGGRGRKPMRSMRSMRSTRPMRSTGFMSFLRSMWPRKTMKAKSMPMKTMKSMKSMAKRSRPSRMMR